MSEERQEVNLSSVTGLKQKRRYESDELLVAKLLDEEDIAQERVITIPAEVISMILKALDFRGLKRVSLVCRLWHREARLYMRKRGIARLETQTVQSFVDSYQNKLPELPHPFESIAVVEMGGYYEHKAKDLIKQLLSLCPPVMADIPTLRITRLCLWELPMDLAIHLIIQSAPSLEYLQLFSPSAFLCKGMREDNLLPLDQKEMSLPELRHLKVDTDHSRGGASPFARSYFSALIVWIVGASPELDTFNSSGGANGGTDTVASEFLLKVNIQNVKSLVCLHWELDGAALEHFVSIPFAKIEFLKLILCPTNGLLRSVDVLVATAAKCTATLRVLDLSFLSGDPEAMTAFPVCPVVEELLLNSFRYSTNFLAERFPSLEVLQIRKFTVEVRAESWRDLTPCFGLKTLRGRGLGFERGEEPFKFFDKFPALECVHLDDWLLLRCCRLRASGDPNYSRMLEGIKHLELDGMKFRQKLIDSDYGFAPLAVLKGLETITMMAANFDVGIASIPFSKLLCLKVFRFAWTQVKCSSMMNQLLEIARQVERVVVTNCCKLRCHEKRSSLEDFFHAARNAECGCKEWQKRSPSYLDPSWKIRR